MRKLFCVIACFLILSLLPISAFGEVVEVQSSADSYIDDVLADVNFGTSSFGYAWWSPILGTDRFLLQFSLSSIPSNATINSAVLNLWGENVYDDSSFNVRTHRAISPWSETTVTWNNFGPGGIYDPIISSQTSVSDLTGWYTWDLTNLVRSWLAGSAPNYGIILTEEADNWNGARFRTRDYVLTSLRPKLVVNYTVPTPPPVITQPTAPVSPPATVTPAPVPVATPKKVQKKKVITSFHKKKCKNKKFHVSHCKKVANKKQAKKNKVFHKKKCSKVITTSSANLKTDLLFKRKR